VGLLDTTVSRRRQALTGNKADRYCGNRQGTPETGQTLLLAHCYSPFARWRDATSPELICCQQTFQYRIVVYIISEAD
jgi:hypothetical protein